MLNEKKIARAKEMVSLVNEYLEKDGYKFSRSESDDGEYIFHFGAIGEDLPMQFALVIDTDRELIRLLSSLPFTCPQEKILDCALATSVINYRIADGSFDFNLRDGKIYYRMTSSYMESIISSTLIGYVIDCSCFTVDKYNDKLYALVHGKVTLEEFENNL